MNGAGGAGGGGAGGGCGTNGTVNTGGGGGGATGNYNCFGLGGSGIVILTYPSRHALPSNVTGSPTFTVSGGYNIYTFTGSGSITF